MLEYPEKEIHSLSSLLGYEELYKSDDGGNSWNIITSNETNGGKIDQLQISKSNPDVIYFTDNANIFKTNDGGNNWTNVSSSLPNKTITSIAIHPTNEDRPCRTTIFRKINFFIAW